MPTEIILLELTFPNAEFNAPFSGRSRSNGSDASGEVAASGGSRDGAAPIVGLLLIVGLAIALRALRRRNDHQNRPGDED